MKSPENRIKILVVDDDDLIIQSIRMCVDRNSSVVGVTDPKEIPKDTFHAAFVDMHLSGNLNRAEGLEVVRELSQRDPHLEIVAMSGHLDRQIMEGCLRHGATRFLAKPLSPEEIKLTMEKIEALHLLRSAATRANQKHLAWIGNSPASQEVRRHIASLRGEPGPILIEGESGTGKEVAASLIAAQEAERPFISVNVAALPENVFESEVFGHVRGAFTGADQNKMGLAEAANGGDLFLDEIEALPYSLQAKLLRFLENGEVKRVGAKDTIRVDVRVICASNQNLNQMVRENKFREDLLWRLNGKKILLPPLRERSDDIGDLAEFFLQKERPRRNKELSIDAKQALSAYHFPGNVRELKRVCEQLSLYSPLPIIRAEDVQKVIGTTAGTTAASAPVVDLSRGLNVLVEEYEAFLIRQALASGKDMDMLAHDLKISRSSLYKKIKDYNISTSGS